MKYLNFYVHFQTFSSDVNTDFLRVTLDDVDQEESFFILDSNLSLSRKIVYTVNSISISTRGCTRIDFQRFKAIIASFPSDLFLALECVLRGIR